MTPYESIKHNNLWAMKINTRFKLPLVAITISANMFLRLEGQRGKYRDSWIDKQITRQGHRQ